MKVLLILFIGNSLTFVNDLPRQVAKLAEARGHAVKCEMYAPGGYHLSQHVADPQALKLIKSRKWDIVVLQEQSQVPAFSEEQVKRDVYPYAKKLCALIRAASPKARIVFYQTMAKKNGDPSNIGVAKELATYEGMQKRIDRTYRALALANGAELAPVGEVWKEVRSARPSLELYSDETHPNLNGSYLAACVFYQVIFGENPDHLPHPSQIDNQTALFLQGQRWKIID
jgi:hypothetical protein